MVKSSIQNFSEVFLGTKQEVFIFLAEKAGLSKLYSFCQQEVFMESNCLQKFFGFWLCSFLVRRFIAFSRKKIRGIC